MAGTWIRKPTGSTSIVFIHGFLSSGETCWRHPNGIEWPSLLAAEEELLSAGIYVFTYQTSVFSGTYRLGDVVDALKEHMGLDGVLESRRIVFVCHSMGGIVARKYVVERAADFLEKGMSVGIFLVASPSLGTIYANWIRPLASLFGHAQADALRFSENNTWLRDLDREFLNLKEKRRLNMIGKELVEDKFVVFRRFWRRPVVPPFSGARYFGEPFKVPGSDHFSIAKIENRDAIQHRLLVKFAADIIGGPTHKRLPQGDERKSGHFERHAPSKVIRAGRFEASAESDHPGRFLKYRLYESGRSIRFSDTLDLWEHDTEFVDFYLSIFKQCGYQGFLWETPAVSAKSVHRDFEFVIHSLPKASLHPDYETYKAYFNTKNAPDGIVAFENLGRDALLLVPSPFRKDANYSGLAEFFQEAPVSQQRGLWRELARHAKLRLSDRPMWLSVAGGGISWLHLRLDSVPKYYRYDPYTTP